MEAHAINKCDLIKMCVNNNEHFTFCYSLTSMINAHNFDCYSMDFRYEFNIDEPSFQQLCDIGGV